jgi:membrane-bound serine protease (ClpP class)
VLVVLGLIALILFGVPWGLVALVAGLLLEILEYMAWKRFLRRYRLRSGPETLVGTTVTVVDDCAPLGRVRLHGEFWNARCRDPIAEGARARITGVDGLTLEIEPER